VIISVPKEIMSGERRVALTPDVVKRLVNGGATVRLQTGAGGDAGYPDGAYTKVGAEIVDTAEAVWKDADILVKVQPPVLDPASGGNELEHIKQGAVLITSHQRL